MQIEDWKSILEHAADPVVIRQGFVVTWVNHAFCRALGYQDASELCGVDLRALMLPPPSGSISEMLCLREAVEVSMWTRTGGVTVWELSAVSKGPGDVLVHIARQVGERKRLEEQAAIAHRIAAAGALTAGISHEIANPLAAILANVEIALRSLGNEPDAEALREITEALTDTRDAAHQLRRTTREIRQLAGAQGRGRGPVDVNRLLELTLRVASTQLRRRARISTELGALHSVHGNEAELSQVFLEVLQHAEQALPDLGQHENSIHISTRQEGGVVIVALVEAGASPGLPRDSRGAGTLAISRRILASIGGSLDVSRPAGGGTCYRLSMPATAHDGRDTAPAGHAHAMAHS